MMIELFTTLRNSQQFVNANNLLKIQSESDLFLMYYSQKSSLQVKCLLLKEYHRIVQKALEPMFTIRPFRFSPAGVLRCVR